MRGAGVGLNRTKENDMTDNPRILAARDREAYGWKLDSLSDLQHEEAAARRADWLRIDKRNSPEAKRKAIYDTPPSETPFVSSILPK
jgi:hypothetical protein